MGQSQRDKGWYALSHPPPIFTFGHGKQVAAPFGAIMEALDERNVDRIIDVRARPSSSYNPPFTKNKLEAVLGPRYEWRGDTLGNAAHFNLPAIPAELYDAAISDLYRRSAHGERLAIFCSETKWKTCHRYDPITLDLLAIGARVVHLQPVAGDWRNGVTEEENETKGIARNAPLHRRG